MELDEIKLADLKQELIEAKIKEIQAYKNLMDFYQQLEEKKCT